MKDSVMMGKDNGVAARFKELDECNNHAKHALQAWMGKVWITHACTHHIINTHMKKQGIRDCFFYVVLTCHKQLFISLT